MDRDEIAARVDDLALRRDSFESEVRRFATGLDDGERALLGEILLERAQAEGVFADAYERRVGAKGWFRRQWDKAAERSGTS